MDAQGRRPRGVVVAIGVVWSLTLTAGVAFWVAVGTGLAALAADGGAATPYATVAQAAAVVSVTALVAMVTVGTVAVHLDERQAWLPYPRVPAPVG